jgi:hypothetical protein
MSRLVRLAVGAGLLASVSACTKASPAITLVSHGSTTHFEAQQWCGGGGALDKGSECPGSGPSHDAVLKVRDGDQVGIDVDSDLVDPGWYLYDVDAKTNITGVRTSHYYALANVLFDGRPVKGVIRLEVRTVDHVPTGDTDLPKVTGRWQFQLVQKD